MNVLVAYQGWYGERMLKFILKHAPSTWAVNGLKLPIGAPEVPEDGEGLIEGFKPPLKPELLIYLPKEVGWYLLLPTIVELTGVKALIAPSDDYGVFPRGLETQVKKTLEGSGVSCVFPRPFCSLRETGHPVVDRFASIFGAPKLKARIKGRKLVELKVVRGSPCGSTHALAIKLAGMDVEEALSKAPLHVQTYPCLASHVEDPLIKESMIHASGKLVKEALKEAIQRALKEET